MKRKKPPVALISVLVCAALGLVIASGAWKFYNLSPEDQMKQRQEEEMARQRAAMTKPDMSKVDAKAETQSLAERLKKTEKTAEAPAEEMRHKSIPTVILPDPTAMKPVKNTSAPSSQWYR